MMQQFPSLLFITVHPERLDTTVLGMVDVVLAVGDAPWQTVSAFAPAEGRARLREAIECGYTLPA